MHTYPAPHSGPDGYELFRRAIVERDEQAWAEGTARYRAMLISWAGRCTASAVILDHRDDIADIAFARAWAALTPERFAKIPNLPALLGYLRNCVRSAVIDCARSEQQHERVAQALTASDVDSPEQSVLARLDGEQIWQLAWGMVQTEQERVILVDKLIYGLRSNSILARHPHLFEEIGQVYATTRNLLERLKRNPELQRLYAES